jgi:hypothetical protein
VNDNGKYAPLFQTCALGGCGRDPEKKKPRASGEYAGLYVAAKRGSKRLHGNKSVREISRRPCSRSTQGIPELHKASAASTAQMKSPAAWGQLRTRA